MIFVYQKKRPNGCGIILTNQIILISNGKCLSRPCKDNAPRNKKRIVCHCHNGKAHNDSCNWICCNDNKISEVGHENEGTTSYEHEKIHQNDGCSPPSFKSFKGYELMDKAGRSQKLDNR